MDQKIQYISYWWMAMFITNCDPTWNNSFERHCPLEIGYPTHYRNAEK